MTRKTSTTYITDQINNCEFDRLPGWPLEARLEVVSINQLRTHHDRPDRVGFKEYREVVPILILCSTTGHVILGVLPGLTSS